MINAYSIHLVSDDPLASSLFVPDSTELWRRKKRPIRWPVLPLSK